MIFHPVERKQGLLILPNPEGSTIFGPGDDLDINIPMGLEGLLIRDK
jgi:hypothetical protein